MNCCYEFEWGIVTIAFASGDNVHSRKYHVTCLIWVALTATWRTVIYVVNCHMRLTVICCRCHKRWTVIRGTTLSYELVIYLWGKLSWGKFFKCTCMKLFHAVLKWVENVIRSCHMRWTVICSCHMRWTVILPNEVVYLVSRSMWYEELSPFKVVLVIHEVYYKKKLY